MPALVAASSRGRIAMHWIVERELACAIIDEPGDTLEPTRYFAVLETIHRQAPILPMRYATRMADEAEIRGFLLKRRHELMLSLERVEGASEIGLRVWSPEIPPSEDQSPSDISSSLDYLLRRRSFYEDKDRLDKQSRMIVERYVREMDGLYRQWRNLSVSPSNLVRLSFLVDQELQERFFGQVKAMTNATHEDHCELLGPWPPFSFV